MLSLTDGAWEPINKHPRHIERNNHQDDNNPKERERERERSEEMKNMKEAT